MKTRVRRTELTIEFEQVYRSRRSRSFLPCKACERINARVPLTDAVWLLRGVLAQLENLLAKNADSPVCLFCLCGRAIENKEEKEQEL
jgi:hypothetical protein